MTAPSAPGSPGRAEATRNERADGPPAPAGSTLLRDALLTIVTRFALAILIFGSDVLLARILGPAAKGRFAIVLLYAQLAAVVVAWGMDSALAVVAGRDREAARRGMGNAVAWSMVVGGACVALSWFLYSGLGHGAPDGPLATLIPNLSRRQFLFGAVALPGEMFFAIGLFGLLGRRRMVGYNVIRVMRRGVLVVLLVAVAAIGTVNLDVALRLNLAALGASAIAIGWVAWKDGTLGFRPEPALLGEELRFGSRAIFGSIAERLQFRADSFLLNALVGVRATGVYSVTSGLAETLWYIPNSLGTVMFSRAVDPKADAGRVAAVLTRTTVAVTVALAVPAWLLGPRLVRVFYGSQFTDAGVALRWILPGIVAYSVVAVLSRYIVGRGRPGIGTLVLAAGLAANLGCNAILIPRMGIIGAAASSSISYALTAIITIVVFRRLSGRGYLETLVVRPSDLRALLRTTRTVMERAAGRRSGSVHGLPGGETAAEIVLAEHDPGEER